MPCPLDCAQLTLAEKIPATAATIMQTCFMGRPPCARTPSDLYVAGIKLHLALSMKSRETRSVGRGVACDVSWEIIRTKGFHVSIFARSMPSWAPFGPE